MRAPQIIVVGASLGGAQALPLLLGGLPPGFPIPLAIVQHRSREETGPLGVFLQQHSRLPVHEVEDKMPILAARVYLAPADYHLLIDAGAFALSTEAPVNYARPAIDVLFETAAESYAAQALGVVLTGASGDGAQGLARIKRRGGQAIVQAPGDAICAVMPLAALAATSADWVLPLAEIAPLLVRLSSGSGHAHSLGA